MTEPIAVDVPGKPAFARSTPLPPVTAPVLPPIAVSPPAPAPRTDTPPKPEAPKAEAPKPSVAATVGAVAVGAAVAAATGVPPVPATTPPPTAVTDLLARITKKQLAIGASAVLSLAAGIGAVRLMFPAKSATPTTPLVSSADQTVLPKNSGASAPPAPSHSPKAPAVDVVPASAEGTPSMGIPLAPTGGPMAPGASPPTARPTVITPLPTAPVIAVEPPAPPGPSRPAPTYGTTATPPPPAFLPPPASLDHLPIPAAPGAGVLPAGGSEQPKPPPGPSAPPAPGGTIPSPALPPLPAAPAAPGAPTASGGMPGVTPVTPPAAPPGGMAPAVPPPAELGPVLPSAPAAPTGSTKPPEPALPPIPGATAPALPVTPAMPPSPAPPAPGGMVPAPTGMGGVPPLPASPPTPPGPMIPAPGAFPPPVDVTPKPDLRPVPTHSAEPPVGVGTPTAFTKPGGSTEVKPLVPEIAPKTDFDVDLYDPRANDSYESISQEYYNDKRYAAALKAFNRNQPLQGGRLVEVPPMHILKKRFAGQTGSVVPVSGSGGAPAERPQWSAAVDKPEAIPARIAASGRGVFVVPPGGMTLKAVAREKLGSEQRWRDIFDLNPQFTDPGLVLSPGTELRLPSDARLP